jgi:phosphohistidine swiveling domain-containing protein
MYISNLRNPITEDLAGAKGYHLSKMIQSGYPVPEGFVILSNAFDYFPQNKKTLSEAFLNELEMELKTIGAKKYMVRSSAIGEDGADSSFAGQLSSFISSSQIEDITAHIHSCWKSYDRENVKTYQNKTGKQLNGMAVVVQTLIEPDYAGVIFTRNPSNETELLIEYVEGHAEKLVSGEVNPESFTVSITSKTELNKTPIPFKEGVKLAIKLEKFYKSPLDIEWAIKNNIFYIVQARPITTTAKSKKIYWSNTNVNENYPDALTPLLYSIARDSYYHYFKNLSKLFQISDAKISALECSYANVIGAFGCKMYYNMSSIHEIISASPFSETLGKSFDNFVGYAESEKIEKKIGVGNKFKFISAVFKFNSKLETTVTDFETVAFEYVKKVDAAISFDDLRLCFHAFIEIRMHSWYKASLADFFAMLYHGILGKYCKKFYGTDAEGVHNKIIQAIPGLISSNPIILIYKIKCSIRKNQMVYDHFKSLNASAFYYWLNESTDESETRNLIHDYIENWGYRCSGELMLTTKNYCEEPEKFIQLLQQYDSLPDSNPEELIALKYEERNKYIADFKKRIYSKNGVLFPVSLIQIGILNLLIKLAIKGIASRERVRLKQALIYFKFKQLINKSGIEFQKRNLLLHADDIFYLRYQEIIEHFSTSYMLTSGINEHIAAVREAFQQNKNIQYPDDFASYLGEYPVAEKLYQQKKEGQNTENAIVGLSVCGGIIKGRAKVLSSVMDASKLELGDILVTRQTDPGWVVVFPLISGLIVERGGMLSHGAIVSREFGIPAIVGVENATLKIKDNDLIILNADTGEITIVNE